eukprot:CAMPEP_0201738696 /NCGR_PEP_ID=MMETSP0593-20130828/45388_1 /ASSEMBLY_ACC=CAM_ASM_000672 /TAXON_ID=267983 /ORGANISM="Skeletonema japonicum, Strain CCMP2506" /LENGTH=557 /DNA_ID=CAMNT_0048232923 /DNA_START=171 /DNA_END=1845 /DNA_ORIENTATION=-
MSAFQPSIFNWRPTIEDLKQIPNTIVNFNFNITNNKSRSKRASEIDSSLAEPAQPAPKKKKVKQAFITATSPPSRKQKRRVRNGRRMRRSHPIDKKLAPPAIFRCLPIDINETIAPPKEAKPTASRNKKRRADDSMNEMGASAQKKKVVVDANDDMDIDCNKEPNDYFMSSSSEEEEESLAGTFFLPETPMDFFYSSSDSDEESSLESTTRQDWVARMSRDDAATIILAFARGFSNRTMKPRARKQQAELDTTATTSAEDVSFSNEFTEEEANDGDVGGVVDEDAIELAPHGNIVEEGDCDIADEDDSDADTATSTEDQSSLSNDTTVEEANNGDEESSLESTTRQDWVARMSRDDAATIIQAFARGFSNRTMKPTARKQQAELDTTATTSAEDVSFSNEFTEEEANDGDVGGVVDEDAIELAPHGNIVEEGDCDIADEDDSDADTATSTEDQSSLSNDTTVEEANNGDSGASLEVGEVNEQVSNILSHIISTVERKERKERSYLREKARIESTLDEIIGLDPLGVDKSLGYEVVVEGYFGVLIAVGVVLLSSRNGK